MHEVKIQLYSGIIHSLQYKPRLSLYHSDQQLIQKQCVSTRSPHNVKTVLNIYNNIQGYDIVSSSIKEMC